MKLELKTGEGTSKVLIDGIDLSNKITGLDIKIKGREMPIVTLEIPVKDIDIEGEFEVFKDIKKKSSDDEFPLNVNGETIGKLIIEQLNCR